MYCLHGIVHTALKYLSRPAIFNMLMTAWYHRSLSHWMTTKQGGAEYWLAHKLWFDPRGKSGNLQILTLSFHLPWPGLLYHCWWAPSAFCAGHRHHLWWTRACSEVWQSSAKLHQSRIPSSGTQRSLNQVLISRCQNMIVFKVGGQDTCTNCYISQCRYIRSVE